MINLSFMLDRNASENPDKLALYYSETEQWTHKQLLDDVLTLCTGLRRAGFKEGDRIALILGNTPEFLIAYFAIIRAGFVVVPMNVMLQKFELEYQLANSGAVGIITNNRSARIFKSITPQSTAVKKQIFALRDGAHKVQWSEIEFDSQSEGDIAPTYHDTLAQINYTAAMAGYSNGAMLTHGSLTANSVMTKKAMGTQENDRYLSAIPLFHTFGIMANCLAPLVKGASVYLHARFNPKDYLASLKEHSITVINGVPSLFTTLLMYDGFDPSYFETVRLAISGGAAMPLDISQKYRNLGIEITQGYGLTECSPAVCVNPFNGPNKLETIGLPLEGVQLKISDANGKELGDNEQGELLVKGELVMKGYWNNSELTEKTIRDGWLHTGDLAKRDEDGYYSITGRLKDMIITGGFNVYPLEVARLLSTHSKIGQVSIRGIPDLIQGEVVQADVRLKPGEMATEKELMHHARRVMALYKVPRIINILQ